MKKFLWRAFKVLLGIFIAFHIYALVLRVVPAPITATMVKRSLQGEDVRRDWTRIENISPYLVDAIIGAEDSRFCQHSGIDWDAIGQALEDNQDGGRRRGGSTITQQTAKNVFFWNGGGYFRKAGEAWMASIIDFVWGKTRTMEVYLNVAEWGDGIFGAEAAAQHRFGKSAADLTRYEAALLAAVLPSPHKWRVDPPGNYVRGRAGTLQKRMSVVRNSGYSNCVKGLADYPYTAPAEKAQKPEPEPTPQELPEPESEKADEPILDETAEPENIEEIMPAPESEANNPDAIIIPEPVMEPAPESEADNPDAIKIPEPVIEPETETEPTERPE